MCNPAEGSSDGTWTIDSRPTKAAICFDTASGKYSSKLHCGRCPFCRISLSSSDSIEAIFCERLLAIAVAFTSHQLTSIVMLNSNLH